MKTSKNNKLNELLIVIALFNSYVHTTRIKIRHKQPYRPQDYGFKKTLVFYRSIP